MAKELVLSVLSKLQSYVEAESQLGLHYLFKAAQECGSQTNKHLHGTCRDGFSDERVSTNFIGRLYTETISRGVDIEIRFQPELKKNKSGYAARKPLFIQLKTSLKLNAFSELSSFTSKLAELNNQEKVVVETDSTNYTVTFLSKSITLFKELKLTREEADRKIVLAALLHLSSYWSVQLSQEGNEDLAEAGTLASELSAESSFGDTTLYSKQWHESPDNKKATRYLRLSTVYSQTRHMNPDPGAKVISCPKKVDLSYRYPMDEDYIGQKIKLKTSGVVLEDDEICSSCSNQLSCLVSNYLRVPYNTEVIVPV